NEREEVKDIVENATHLLDMIDLYVADNPLGVRSRKRDMIQRLDIQQSNNIMLLGLCKSGLQ
ncbi:TMV resistance protein N-like, partial [Trifolium medium]|nr:TMV resistance protein N-like [Trifolium medium]